MRGGKLPGWWESGGAVLPGCAICKFRGFSAAQFRVYVNVFLTLRWYPEPPTRFLALVGRILFLRASWQIESNLFRGGHGALAGA